MPLIRCDYSKEQISEQQISEIVKLLLKVSEDAFNYSPEQALELVSIFSAPYGKSDHSAAAAEIELRAKIGEFDHPAMSRDEVRVLKMQPYEVALKDYIQRENLVNGIVFTITFEDWKVSFLPGS